MNREDIIKLARAAAIKFAHWDNWDSNEPASGPNGNEPHEEREYWISVVEFIADVAPPPRREWVEEYPIGCAASGMYWHYYPDGSMTRKLVEDWTDEEKAHNLRHEEFLKEAKALGYVVRLNTSKLRWMAVHI